MDIANGTHGYLHGTLLLCVVMPLQLTRPRSVLQSGDAYSLELLDMEEGHHHMMAACSAAMRSHCNGCEVWAPVMFLRSWKMRGHMAGKGIRCSSEGGQP